MNNNDRRAYEQRWFAARCAGSAGGKRCGAMRVLYFGNGDVDKSDVASIRKRTSCAGREFEKPARQGGNKKVSGREFVQMHGLCEDN